MFWRKIHSNKENIVMQEKKTPLKIGVRLEPPAIVYIYSQFKKMRMRVMPVRNVWSKTDANFVLDDIQNRHGKYLELVPEETIKKMIHIIISYKRGMKLHDILEKYENNISRDRKTGEIHKQSENKMLIQEKQRTTPNFPEVNKIESLKRLNLNNNSDGQSEIKINIENKKTNSTFPVFTNNRSNFSFGNNNPSSESEESDYEKNQDEFNIDSDEDLEINKFLRQNELSRSNKPLQSPAQTIESPEKEKQSKLTEGGIMKILKGNLTKNEDPKKQDSASKNNSLKELLEVHNKIESLVNSKNGKSEDDTDVEFDDSDIPLEEDFY